MPVGARGLESVLSVVAFGFSVVVGLVLLWRVRRETLVRNLGIALALAAVAGPAAWPWYLSWGLALLAATPELQASRAIAPALALSVLAVKADGILAFPLHTAPVFVALYLALVIFAVRSARRPAIAMHRLRPRALAGS